MVLLTSYMYIMSPKLNINKNRSFRNCVILKLADCVLISPNYSTNYYLVF